MVAFCKFHEQSLASYSALRLPYARTVAPQEHARSTTDPIARAQPSSKISFRRDFLTLFPSGRNYPPAGLF